MVLALGSYCNSNSSCASINLKWKSHVTFSANQIAVSFKFTHARDFHFNCYCARTTRTAVSFKFTHAFDFRSDLLSHKICCGSTVFFRFLVKIKA